MFSPRPDPPNPRLFFAVEIPAPLQGAIGVLCRSHAPIPGVRWVTPSTLHLTLRFLGAAPRAFAGDVAGDALAICREFPSFEVRLAGGGVFPQRGPPRVGWIGVVQGEESLRTLAAELEDLAVRYGFAPELRPFRAHLTVARVKRGRAPGLREALGSAGELGAFVVRDLVLFESVLMKTGPRYVPLARSPLAPGDFPREPFGGEEEEPCP